MKSMKEEALNRQIESTLDVASRLSPTEPRPFYTERTMAVWRAGAGAYGSMSWRSLPRLSLAALAALLVANVTTALLRDGHDRVRALHAFARSYHLAPQGAETLLVGEDDGGSDGR